MDEKKAPQSRREAFEQIRQQHNENDIDTQCERLATALQQFGSITTFEASRFLDVYHPPARAMNLRRRGYNILTVRETVLTESGKRHRVGKYVLVSTPGTEAA